MFSFARRGSSAIRESSSILSSLRAFARGHAARIRFADRMRDWDVDLVYANTLLTFYTIDAARGLGIPSIWNLPLSSPLWIVVKLCLPWRWL